MEFRYNRKLVSIAQILRRNMTPEERHLWYDFLKKLPVTVNRQKNIGNYVVDFYISSAKLVIELDGSQHFTEKNQESDTERSKYLKSLGLLVLRYSNEAVRKNFDLVCNDIFDHLNIEPK